MLVPIAFRMSDRYPKMVTLRASLRVLYRVMNNKTRSVIRAVAIILVLLCVVMQMRWVIIPAIDGYRFWIVVVSFAAILITSK
jgi:hypothetical protein